jgi:hypothetical protein
MEDQYGTLLLTARIGAPELPGITVYGIHTATVRVVDV